MEEDYTRDLTVNWTGTGSVVNAGVADTEYLSLSSGQYMESENWKTGTEETLIELDHYGSGSGPAADVYYKTSDDPSNFGAMGWTEYTGQFSSLGWVKIRLERT